MYGGTYPCAAAVGSMYVFSLRFSPVGLYASTSLSIHLLSITVSRNFNVPLFCLSLRLDKGSLSRKTDEIESHEFEIDEFEIDVCEIEFETDEFEVGVFSVEFEINVFEMDVSEVELEMDELKI